MLPDKKNLRIITNHPELLNEVVTWYNQSYQTDFVFVGFYRDEVNFAIIEFEESSETQVFDLGRVYGNEYIRRNLKSDLIL